MTSSGRPSDRRRSRRNAMPYTGVGRVEVFVESPSSRIPDRARLFLWDLSAGGGSVMISSPLPFRAGANLRLIFEDTLAVYPRAIPVTIVWIKSDAFGFRFSESTEAKSFLSWAKVGS